MEKGIEKECGVTHIIFLLFFVEERNKALTLSCEGILDAEGYGSTVAVKKGQKIAVVLNV